jgi:hypothetical protein
MKKKHPNWGGAREGAGRPRAQKRTRVVRLPLETIEKLEYYEHVQSLIESFRILSESASPTSPRWEKCRELLDQLTAITKVSS